MHIVPERKQTSPARSPQETGCTVYFVDGGIDTGPVIVLHKVPVLPGDTVETLMNRIHAQEHIAYPEALQKIASGRA